MNTANKLTMLRVILIPVFLVLLYLPIPFHRVFALVIFILASVTDFIDGYVARHYNQITDFGKFMDPLADKILVLEDGQLVAWGTHATLLETSPVYGEICRSQMKREVQA